MEKMSAFVGLTSTTPVTVVGNDNLEGSPIITPLLDNANNPKVDLMGNPLGSIRLEQETTSLAGGTFLNSRRRVAFMASTMETLAKVVAANKLVNGSQIPGKIMVTESLEPFWNGQNGKINPSTEEPIGVTVGERFFPVYLKMNYTEDMSAKDTYIRTPEDVAAWLATRQVLAGTNKATVETSGVPQA